MSLRTTYTGALDTAINAAIAAGSAWGTTNNAAINTALTTASGLGQSTVTYSANATHNPAGMILQGTIWNAFKSGLYQYLASEDIMTSELSFSIAAVDATTNAVTITFTF